MSTAGSIGITLGDPSGIGPEIAAAAIAGAPDAVRRRLILFGDGPIIDRAFAQVTGKRVPADVTVVDPGILSADQAVLGQPSEGGARAQVAYLEAAARAARSHTIAGLVTGPICKREARRAGFDFAGHTEFLAERLGARRVVMHFASPSLHVALATTHLALADVARALTIADLAAVIAMVADAMASDFGRETVHVGVLGLNPHAGENGLFGREEIDIIAPAIEDSRRQLGARATVSGPLVPDAAFRPAAGPAADCDAPDVFVAMYHDQGLIPMKLLAPRRAVNVTLGLPIVRTSPDHGVAYHLAGKGRASAEGFVAALDLAVELVDRRSGRAGDRKSATESEPGHR